MSLGSAPLLFGRHADKKDGQRDAGREKEEKQSTINEFVGLVGKGSPIG